MVNGKTLRFVVPPEYIGHIGRIQGFADVMRFHDVAACSGDASFAGGPVLLGVDTFGYHEYHIFSALSTYLEGIKLECPPVCGIVDGELLP
jgi:hypothetical protein